MTMKKNETISIACVNQNPNPNPNPNYPSKTGEKSGGGRGNEPKSK
jgi:hypothetical protein